MCRAVAVAVNGKGKAVSIRAGYETQDGGAVTFPAYRDLTVEQTAFLFMTMSVGMPRLDEKTIDEFVRRVDLWQTYVGPFLTENGKTVPVTRKILAEILAGHKAAWTNVNRITKRDFDAVIKKEKEARR